MTYETLVQTLSPEINLDSNMVANLKRYSSLLIEWNEKMNLTAIKEEGEIVEKHFLDSLLPAKSPLFIGNRIADIGTGAGFPGLVYAIVFPNKKIVLVEATGKKCTFLEAVKKALNLQNVTILNTRAEDLTERDTFDITIARALAPLNVLLEILVPWTKVHGKVVAMKGEKGEEEMVGASKAIKELGIKLLNKDEGILPECQEKRINYFFEKETKTFKRYPRTWAEIVKKPL